MALQTTQRSKKGYRGPKGKTVYAHMGIWQNQGVIHLTIPTEKDFHTTVNNKDGSIRCHRNLYMHLRKLLQKNKCWS